MLPRMLTLAAVLSGLALPVLAQTAAPAAPVAPTAPAAAAAAPAAAATPATRPAPTRRQASPAQLAQQQRMRDCNAQARTQSLAGDPRRTFMRSCLSTHPAAAAATAPTPATTPSATPRPVARRATTPRTTAPATAPATTPAN